MPSPEVFEALDKGVIDVALGGCCVSEDDMDYVCRACGVEFGASRRKPGREQPGGDALV